MDTVVPIELGNVCVLAAKATRRLWSCSTVEQLLPQSKGIREEFVAWYDDLAPISRVSELEVLPWSDDKVQLAYVHLEHLGAISLALRKTLSICESGSNWLHELVSEQGDPELARLFMEGVWAAKQAARMVYLFLGQGTGTRHCWGVMYVFPALVGLLIC